MSNSSDKCKPEQNSALQTYLADFETKFELIKERAMCIKESGGAKMDEIGVEVQKSVTVIKESTGKTMSGIKEDFKVAFGEAKIKLSDSWEITKNEFGKIGEVIKTKSREVFNDPEQ